MSIVNNEFFIEKISGEKISQLAIKALIFEVSLFPKAGLVTKYSRGSHKDMDFELFKKSATSLKKYFINCYEYSKQNSFESIDFFIGLRELGKEAEKNMFQATNGINTHKGTIFSMGILISVISVYLVGNRKINLFRINKDIIKMCKSLEYELGENIADTKGERIYKKYKIKGARGLALSGYEIVLLDGIEKLYKFLEKLDLETSCIILLLYYMSNLDDTNIIGRSDIHTLREVQRISKKIYNKNLLELNELEIKKDMLELDKNFIKKNISPGGSADLLILTIFLYFLLENKE